MITMDAAHGLAQFVVGGGGDRTCVEHDQVRIARFGNGCEAFRGKAGFNRGAVGLGGAAAEVFEVEALQ